MVDYIIIISTANLVKNSTQSKFATKISLLHRTYLQNYLKTYSFHKKLCNFATQ